MVQVGSALRVAYAEFQRHPVTHICNVLRRTRGAQLRRTLADPGRIDLETFNREMWRFGPDIEFEGLKTNFYDLRGRDLPEGWLSRLQQALEGERIELHGNYTWHGGSQIFNPAGKDIVRNTELIRQALRILNGTSLVPQEKAQEIEGIFGFGASSATGMVMLFHPDEFAMRIDVSKVTPEKVGHGLSSFIDIMHQLKEQLDARDYLELDAFLDLLLVGGIQLEETPEIMNVECAASEQAGKIATGQRFLLDPAIRLAIERYSMDVATQHYRAQRWTVKDVSMRESYDLHCTRDSNELHVEVKGTTSAGQQILLTPNEVRHARVHYPCTALFIVANIEINEVPQGGKIILIEPWNIDEAGLVPLTYAYTVPAEAYTPENASA